MSIYLITVHGLPELEKMKLDNCILFVCYQLSNHILGMMITSIFSLDSYHHRKSMLVQASSIVYLLQSFTLCSKLYHHTTLRGTPDLWSQIQGLLETGSGSLNTVLYLISLFSSFYTIQYTSVFKPLEFLALTQYTWLSIDNAETIYTQKS